MGENIQKILDGFDKLKLLVGNPKYSEREIAGFENTVGCKLPETFKTALRAGYIDKGTFHFIIPRLYEYDNSMVVFGSWNEDIFMFDTKQGNGDYPIYVVVGEKDKKPEKRFNNFYEWFDSVLKSVASTNYPE
jgi:hypothetical protein